MHDFNACQPLPNVILISYHLKVLLKTFENSITTAKRFLRINAASFRQVMEKVRHLLQYVLKDKRQNISDPFDSDAPNPF